MVRLLLLSTFFLGHLAFAHDANSEFGLCEQTLNPPQVRTYRFLKKLQVEADTAEIPAAEYIRVAVGPAMGPLVAAMQQAGSQVASLPVKTNFGGVFLTDSEGIKFLQALNTYFPKTSEIGSKKVAVMVYAENPKMVIALQNIFINYLDQLGISSDRLLVRVYTSQMYLRQMQQELGTGTAVTFRPIANANEVRHWMHDGLFDRERLDVSQYPAIDVMNPATVVPYVRAPERKAFTVLKAHIGNLQ